MLLKLSDFCWRNFALFLFILAARSRGKFIMALVSQRTALIFSFARPHEQEASALFQRDAHQTFPCDCGGPNYFETGVSFIKSQAMVTECTRLISECIILSNFSLPLSCGKMYTTFSLPAWLFRWRNPAILFNAYESKKSKSSSTYGHVGSLTKILYSTSRCLAPKLHHQVPMIIQGSRYKERKIASGW